MNEYEQELNAMLDQLKVAREHAQGLRDRRISNQKISYILYKTIAACKKPLYNCWHHLPEKHSARRFNFWLSDFFSNSGLFLIFNFASRLLIMRLERYS